MQYKLYTEKFNKENVIVEKVTITKSKVKYYVQIVVGIMSGYITLNYTFNDIESINIEKIMSDYIKLLNKNGN